MHNPLTCLYNQANEVSRKERARKSLRSRRSPFAEAEAAAEGGSKKDYKRYSRKDRGRALWKG